MPADAIVLHFQWAEGGLTRQETYGPWAIAEDESHLEQVTSFLKDWRRALGCEPSSVTMAVVQDPQKITGEPDFIQIPEGWTPEQIAEFRERWNALPHPSLR